MHMNHTRDCQKNILEAMSLVRLVPVGMKSEVSPESKPEPWPREACSRTPVP